MFFSSCVFQCEGCMGVRLAGWREGPTGLLTPPRNVRSGVISQISEKKKGNGGMSGKGEEGREGLLFFLLSCLIAFHCVTARCRSLEEEPTVVGVFPQCCCAISCLYFSRLRFCVPRFPGIPAMPIEGEIGLLPSDLFWYLSGASNTCCVCSRFVP